MKITLSFKYLVLVLHLLDVHVGTWSFLVDIIAGILYLYACADTYSLGSQAFWRTLSTLRNTCENQFLNPYPHSVLNRVSKYAFLEALQCWHISRSAFEKKRSVIYSMTAYLEVPLTVRT